MPTNEEKAALVRTAISDPIEESNWWEELLAYIYDTNEAATSGGGGGGGLTHPQILARCLGS